jgi:homoserine O-acetyltransferase/O-succinyltransferase
MKTGVHTIPQFALESGEILRNVRQAYVLDGTLNARRDNLVLVFHSLTGAPDSLGGWRGDVIGPGRAIDTGRWAVLCPNLLGSCYGTTFTRGAFEPAGVPRISTRDQARLAGELVTALGVSRVALATGGSLGGMVTLEWAASFPSRSRAAVVFAAPAAHSAWALGFNHAQRRAIEACGPAAGLAIARMIGMLTYRSPAEFESRYARLPGDGAPFAIQSYLDHHGAKLVGRFDAESYLTLLGAMDAHDVGRGRGGAASALAAFRGRLLGVGVTSDVLYPEEEVRRWTLAAGAESRTLVSGQGHDAFLLEPGPVGTVLGEALEASDSALSLRAVEEEEEPASSSSGAAR